MATEKKVVEKKAVAKKAVPASKTKVANKKKPLGSELKLEVPQGGQLINTFELTPKLPKNGKASDWKLVDTYTGETVTSLSVGFSVQSSDIQREFERAVLIVDLAEGIDNAKGHWRFVLNGVEAGERTSDVNHDIATEITNQGRTLIVYIHALDLGKESINYGYLASFTDVVSGVVSIYESKDPGIVVGRPA